MSMSMERKIVKQVARSVTNAKNKIIFLMYANLVQKMLQMRFQINQL